MAANNGMIRVINAVMAGVLIGIMAVVFLTSYSSIIFAGDLARFLPNGIGIALASATIMATVVALVSSHRGIVAAFHKFIARRLATRLADTTRVLREVLE